MRFIKSALVIIGVAFIILHASSSFAQSPTILNGLSYLQSSQTSTGYWGNADEIPCNTFVDTCAVSETLRYFSGVDTTYTSAVQWINTTVVNNNDYLFAQFISLSQAGQDVSSIRDYLLSVRNSDGGWGTGEGIASDIKRTALALQALKTSNYSDYSVLSQAINFLTSNQNTDGGWGNNKGYESADSDVFTTSLVLKSLLIYNGVFINQSPIDKAVTYLLSKQNADGGFGSSPSKIYETALALDALIASGANNITTVVSGGVGYLTTNQLSDGSWNDDPYSTALALRALASARANLVIASNDISLSKSMPQENEAVTITATVHNTGFDSAANIVIRFYLGDPAAGGIQIGSDQVIAGLPVGGAAQASITASFIGTGGKTIFVVADPNNLISETSKADNKTSARLWVATGPDLAVYSEDLKPSTSVPTPGTAFTLSYTVRNLGESPVGAFIVSLYDGDPNAGGTFIQSANTSGMNGSDMRTGTLGVTLTTNGNHTLYLVADSGNQITELSKTNNTGTVTLNVGGTLTAADLVITSMDITLTPSRPHAGDLVQISANVRNIGAEAANNFSVEIFDGSPEAGGVLIASQAISLVAGAEQAVTANWTILPGIHDVYVVLDRMNAISESNETNNRASVRVMTDMVDISLSATDLVFTPTHPVVNDVVSLMITAHNTGIKETGAFNLALYDGDPNAGGTLLKTYAVGSMQRDGTTALTYTFTAAPQTYRFYAVADTESVVTEMYEDNNLAVRSLTIKAPGETLGPDLVPTKIDLTDTTTDSQTLAISGNAHVTFQNKGDDKITTPFNVTVFEDMDGDGKYTAGVDNLLGTSTMVTGPTASIPAIWPEGASMVDVPLSGTVKFLHSPLYAFVDSGDAILEQDETNNLLVSCKDCQVVPLNPIQPVVKWKYIGPSYYPSLMGEGIYQSPVVARLIDTNGDGRIDEKDAPIILFMTYQVIDQYGRGNEKIHAVRGDTGQEIFTIFDTTRPISTDGTPYIAVGDIDNDGLPEIIVPRICNYISSQSSLVAYDHTGNLKWDNCAIAQAWDWDLAHRYKSYTTLRGMPVIADIDGDGHPEIIAGATAVNGSDGSIKWGYTPNSGTGSGSWVNASIVADLDLDGKQEVIAGNTAYNADGTIKWWNKSLTDGITAIGNFDGDPYPEIVLVTGVSPGTRIYLLDHNGLIKWGPVFTKDFDGQTGANTPPPTIADFDGDGQLEIGIKLMGIYVILDKNGLVKKTLSIPLSNVFDGYFSSATVFDLNGDGRPQLLINSDRYFRIFDGKSGSLLYQDQFGSASGAFQNAIVADVDGDGHAEVVVAGYNYYVGPREELRVYGSANNDWAGARGIWNEASYHVTNVNDNGTIPQHEAPSWLLNNTYRTQAAIGPTSNPYLTPNLTASYMRAEQNGSSVNLALRVGNGGAVVSPASVTVTFYDGDSSTGTVIGTASTTRALNPGDFQDVIYSWSGGSLGLHHVYAVVDSANAISECRKDDNQTNTDVTIQVEYADLKIGPEDITLSPAPYYEGIPVPITANIRNIGTLSASNVVVRLYNGNPASGGLQIGTDQIIPSMNAGGSAPLVFNFDTLGKSGTNVLYVVVDPANAIAEASKTNNTASITLAVQPPVLPDLAVSASDVQLAPSSPQEGDKVTVTATVRNLGTAAGNIPVSFYLGNPASGGTLVSNQIVYQTMAFNTTATVQAVIDTTGWAGQQQVYVVIDSQNTIVESNKTNNSASQPIFVQSAGLSASITLDKAIYNAGDVATATIIATESTGVTRSLSLALFVKDSVGNIIATVSQSDPITIGPNMVVTLSRTWNTGTTLAGNYRFTTEITEGGRIISRASASFTITPDTRMNAQVTTDKISYNPNETAAMTTVVTSQSRNTIFQNLTATMTIASASTGTLFTDVKTITTLIPGATFTFKDYVSIGTNPAGTYPVTLTVKDSTGTVIATGTQTLTITSFVKPSSTLRGQIFVDKQRLLSGETVTVSYNVTNIGNVDLSNVALSVLTQ